ncbi:MAG: hypothetical protein PVJ84_02845 [Desulfobacteraceae bacterium]|jgi:hypothetical protein
MAEKIIKTIVLDNDLELRFYDASRKVAGDRWQVTLIARIEIPVEQATFLADENNLYNFKTFMASCENKVHYEQKRTRNFIGATQKDDVLQSLMDSFLTSSLAYLSHPHFPQKYILRQYQAYLKRKTWAAQ